MATDVFNNYFLTTPDITDKKNTTENNTVNINNNTFLHFMSQAFTTKYRCMNSKITTTKETERIIKALKSKKSYGYD
jgi:hypothetical protein